MKIVSSLTVILSLVSGGNSGLLSIIPNSIKYSLFCAVYMSKMFAIFFLEFLAQFF